MAIRFRFIYVLVSAGKLNSALGNCAGPVPRPYSELSWKQNILHLRNADLNPMCLGILHEKTFAGGIQVQNNESVNNVKYPNCK
jgi:hypothetical protein